jgi:hypothetical protein
MTTHEARRKDPAKRSGCSVKILAEPPYDGAPALGMIHLAGRVSQEGEVIRLVNQKACDIGADAVFVRQIQQRSTDGKIDYEISAAAYAIGDDVSPAAPEQPSQVHK